MYLRATIWKLCVTAVKPNSCLQFAPLRSRRTEVRAPVYTQFYSPSTGQGGTGGSNGHRRRNRRFTMQKPQLLQLVAINSPGYVVLDLSLGGGVRDTVSFLSYPLRCFHWADWDFLASVDRESPPPPSSQVGNHNECCVFQPSYQPTEGYNSSIPKHVLPYKGGSHGGKGSFEAPPEGTNLPSVPSRMLDSGHHLPCSLPPVKVRKDTFKAATTEYPHYCLEPSPHKDWPNLTLISLRDLVSHVYMKSI